MNSGITLFSFAIFLVIFLGVGALAAKVSDNTESDYLLGNRSFGKYFIGLSAGATTNSGWIMVGAVGFAYSTGVSSLLLIPVMFLGDLTFWTFFPDKINRISREQDSQTIPEFLGSGVQKTREKRTIAFIVGLLAVSFLTLLTVAQFSAAAKTLNVFFGLDPKIGATIAALSILFYCVTGGLRASIWTDVVQAFVVVFVSFGMLGVALVAGGGIPDIVSQLHEIDPQLTNFFAGYNPWTLIALIVGFFSLAFGFDISQPQVLIRLLAGRSPEEAKAAKWTYLGYVYSTWTAMMLFGIICRVLVPSLADPEQALPLYASENFPPFLVGIILAGIFSVIASTADSLILVTSSALARDISPALHQKMSSRYGIKYEQLVTLLVGIAALVGTIFVSAKVFSLVLFVGGALGGSIGPAMLIILIKRRTHYLALSLAMMAGMSTCIIWQLVGWSSIFNETLPGFVVALCLHEVLMNKVFKLKKDNNIV
ncbi:MAG: sodium/proline symporter [Cyanobacteria bacterium SBLK]|nr:sodium/proline symporter [Cyanobacteria bacterium SBLK]